MPFNIGSLIDPLYNRFGGLLNPLIDRFDPLEAYGEGAIMPLQSWQQDPQETLPAEAFQEAVCEKKNYIPDEAFRAANAAAAAVAQRHIQMFRRDTLLSMSYVVLTSGLYAIAQTALPDIIPPIFNFRLYHLAKNYFYPEAATEHVPNEQSDQAKICLEKQESYETALQQAKDQYIQCKQNITAIDTLRKRAVETVLACSDEVDQLEEKLQSLQERCPS